MSELKISVGQRSILAAIAAVLLADPSSATIYNVPGDYPTIQAAIAAIKDGDEIVVAPGNYNEAIDFLGKAIIVRSSGGPDVTTIDATGLNTSVVSCVNLEGPDTVLDGFKVIGGNAVEGGGMLIEFSSPCVINCSFLSNLATRGGGMFMVGSTVTVTGCTFSGNDANDAGGGVYCNASSPVFSDCVFAANTVITPGFGGGMYCTNFSNATLTNCSFADNFAIPDGGGMYNTSFSATTLVACTLSGNIAQRGGGMFNVNSDLIIMGSTFTNNVVATGSAFGGAIYNSGSDPAISECIFDENSAEGPGGSSRGFGGAIYNTNSSSPTLTACLFTGNTAIGFGLDGGRGGAIYTTDPSSSPVVADCDFISNSAVSTSTDLSQGRGGALYNQSCSPTITNCLFVTNVAEGVSSSGGRRGGAIYNDNDGADPVLTGCTFSGNTADTDGGAIYNAGGDPILTDCTFEENVAVLGSGMFNASNAIAVITNCIFRNNITGVSGGIYNDLSSPSVTNCLFTGNTAASFGGGIFNFNNSDPAIRNCTFSNNNAFDGAAIHNFASVDGPTIANCIMWGNTVTNGHPSIGGNGTPTVTYSDVEAGFDGTGNIEVDPLFVDPDNDDYHISPTSPCIDAADNLAVPKGIVVDLDGEDRFIDDPDTRDTGNGDPPIVDMGAYEFQADETPPCPWDLDGNGSVGASDLLSLLVNWGPCKGCPADFDGNGSVGATDLLALLVNWGPCP